MSHGLRKDVKRFIDQLEEVGVSVKMTPSGNWKASRNGHSMMIHQTPSDQRWRENTVTRLRHEGIIDLRDVKKMSMKAARQRRAEKREADLNQAKQMRSYATDLIAGVGGTYSKAGRVLAEYATRHGQTLVLGNDPNLIAGKLRAWERGESVPSSQLVKTTVEYVNTITEPEPEPAASKPNTNGQMQVATGDDALLDMLLEHHGHTRERPGYRGDRKGAASGLLIYAMKTDRMDVLTPRHRVNNRRETSPRKVASNRLYTWLHKGLGHLARTNPEFVELVRAYVDEIVKPGLDVFAWEGPEVTDENDLPDADLEKAWDEGEPANDESPAPVTLRPQDFPIPSLAISVALTLDKDVPFDLRYELVHKIANIELKR